MQTLLANELQVVFTTGALAGTANLQGGDTTIIAGGINFFPFKLIVRPEVKTGADLHGKKLALSASVLLPTTRPSWLLKSSAAIRNKSPCCSLVATQADFPL